MDKEFQSNLDLLLTDDRDFLFPNWVRAAKYFLSQVISGRDIKPAIGGLGRIFEESHQVPVMEPAIAAIIRQSMKDKKPEILEAFFATRDTGVWVFEALLDLAVKGAHLELFMPQIIRYFHLSPLTAPKILFTILKASSNPHFLELLASTMVQEKGQELNLFRFLKDVPVQMIGPALPYTVQVLQNHQIRLQALQDFRWIADRNPDLNPIEKDLAGLLEDGQADSNALIARYLAVFYLERNQKEKYEGLKCHPWASVRHGALNALDYPRDTSVLLIDRIAHFLLDSDERIPRDAMEMITQRLSQDTTNRVRSRLVSNRFQGTSAHKFWEDLILEGEYKACSICSNLPRWGSWNHELSIPPEVKKLVTFPNFRRCPECGNYYTYSYEDDYEDMRLRVSYTVRRMHPGEVLERLSGADGEAYLQGLPTILETLWKEILTPQKFIKSEAAWKLSQYFLSIGSYLQIISLGENQDSMIRYETLLAVADHSQGLDLKPLKSLLEGALTDKEGEIKKLAAQSLGVLLLDQNDSLEKLLNHGDVAVLSGTLLTLYRWNIKHQESRYLDLVTHLVFHTDPKVREMARRIRSQAQEQGHLIPSILSELVDGLTSPLVDMRNEAIDQLKEVEPQGRAPEIIARVGPCLEDPTSRYSAQKLLIRYGSMEIDLFPAKSFILGPWADIEFKAERLVLIIYLAQKAHKDPRFFKLALAGLTDSSLVPNSCKILTTLYQKDENMSLAIPGLLAFLDRSGGNDSYSQEVMDILQGHYFKVKDIQSMAALIQNTKPSHRLAALYSLKSMVQKGWDLKPLEPILTGRLSDTSSRVQEMAQQLLEGVR